MPSSICTGADTLARLERVDHRMQRLGQHAAVGVVHLAALGGAAVAGMQACQLGEIGTGQTRRLCTRRPSSIAPFHTACGELGSTFSRITLSLTCSGSTNSSVWRW